MTLAATLILYEPLRLAILPSSARIALIALLSLLWTQYAVGVTAIINSVPVHLASAHQCGALTVFSALIFAFHTTRRVDPRHVNNMLGRLKQTNPVEYKKYMEMRALNTPISATEIARKNLFLFKNKTN
jgi:hypothetical protein